MRSTRGESEQYIARRDMPAVDRLRFFDHAHSKAGEVVLARDERVRMLGGFAANQRAARQFAPGRDSLDNIGGDVDVKAFANVVIEEEQWLGALHENIVDAHCDEID